jgi:hypothetical protein
MLTNVNNVNQASINTKERLKQQSNTIEERGLLIASCINSRGIVFLLETVVAPQALSTFLRAREICME